MKAPTERRLVFSQNLVSGDDPERVNLGHVLEEEDKELAKVDDIVHMSKSGWVLSRLRRRLQNGQSLWPQ